MKYTSTREDVNQASSTKAMLHGLAPDGGLYIFDMNSVSTLDLQALVSKSYQEVAVAVLTPFFPEIEKTVLSECIQKAYNKSTFEKDEIVPVATLYKRKYVSELFWGRTMAFKDVALSLFPYLLQEAKKTEKDARITSILTATSGDTGKAAMEGFRDIEGIEITVFYPEYGVSDFQKRQMQTQQGNNTYIYGIDGNFDDAQSALKEVFQDEQFVSFARENNRTLASANSINIGRLLPQVVYYVTSYLKLVEKGEIQFGDMINVVVPTGNFGNIFAGYIASLLGVPIQRFISASNDNDVLADFFETGTYTIENRAFHVTSSPSMDILLSSNFERYLYMVLNQDAGKTKAYMEKLQHHKTLTLTHDEFFEVQTRFYGGRASEEEVSKAIASVYQEEGYLFDPHTAVAYVVGEKYKKQTGDETPQLIMATAHPYKFSRTVTEALKLPPMLSTEEEINQLVQFTNVQIPQSMKHLFRLPKRLIATIAKDEIKQSVKQVISEGE